MPDETNRAAFEAAFFNHGVHAALHIRGPGLIIIKRIVERQDFELLRIEGLIGIDFADHLRAFFKTPGISKRWRAVGGTRQHDNMLRLREGRV